MTKFSVCFVLFGLVLTLTLTNGAMRHKHNKQARRFLLGPSSNTNSSSGHASGGAWPSVFNVATKAKAHANATCGESGREEYCREQHASRSRPAQCGVCDAHSPDPNKRHPAHYATDGESTHWWQSPSLAEGGQYESVSFTLDLGQVYEISYVIVRAGPSSRPASWTLERSTAEEPLDEDYRPWQFFARTQGDCLDLFGAPAVVGKPKPLKGPFPTCTAFFSKNQPLENGEIHVSLVGDPPAEAVSVSGEHADTGTSWSRARHVRLRLLGAPAASRADARFYTLRDVTVGGRCACGGHAHSCRHNVARGHPECECIHHTCGPHCDRCCPMYNQRRYSPGATDQPSICQSCQCHGHASECVYDEEVDKAGLSLNTHGQYKGGGVCVNCQRHTTGINCERCKDGYYRLPGALPNDINPCQKCDCDVNGSTGICKYFDDEMEVLCECKPGYKGRRCDSCDIGYKGFPLCHICPCNKAGTLSMGDCSGDCICKSNVEGKYCDSCKVGFFALDANNPEGCIPCYCSGVSETCHSSIIENHVFQSLADWVVTDMGITQTVLPTLESETGWLSVGNYELPGIESYFWSAPDLYLGNKLKAYGAKLIFRVRWDVMRGDTSGKPTTGPNVILVGHNGLKIAFDDVTYTQPGDELEIVIPLWEDFWYHVPPSVKDIITRLRRMELYKAGVVTRTQFMSLLANVKHILLRAKFHTDQVEGFLEEALILIGSGKSEAIVSYVEKCLCPPGYTGLSCELCAFGYAKIFTNTSDHFEQFECIKCDCNMHAESCDVKTGKCTSCEHNTMGEKCERCISGYYGNPLTGLSDDCKKCGCPLLEESNNFSPSCASDGNDSEKYFCTQCPDGYTGDHCEICDYGFFGEPTVLGSKCEICACNGAPCDTITGQCLSCPGNTEGFKCESCKEDHYGIPSEKDCRPCECDLNGAEDTTCNINTGQCKCRDRYAGRACNECEAGFGNVTAGCIPCSCNLQGSANIMCDPITGHCECKEGVEGFHCDACQYLHYGFSENGCKGKNF